MNKILSEVGACKSCKKKNMRCVCVECTDCESGKQANHVEGAIIIFINPSQPIGRSNLNLLTCHPTEAKHEQSDCHNWQHDFLELKSASDWKQIFIPSLSSKITYTTYITKNNQIITSLTCNIFLFIKGCQITWKTIQQTLVCVVFNCIFCVKRTMGYVSCQPAWWPYVNYDRTH